ncbi:hypothetical protein ACS0TY_029796 [Phlomoides rotata]
MDGHLAQLGLGLFLVGTRPCGRGADVQSHAGGSITIKSACMKDQSLETQNSVLPMCPENTQGYGH